MPVESSANAEPMSGDLQGRRVLFIAYFFPPTSSTGVPGSMRTVKFLRNLHNGECHVLTVPGTLSEADNALAHLKLPVNGEQTHRVAPWDFFKFLLSIRRTIKARLKGSRRLAGHSGAAAPSPNTATFKTATDDVEGRSAFQRLKDFIYDLCYFPDQAGPWIIPAARAGKKLVRTHQIDVIFATGSPWSGLITGYLISKATGKPLIIDFRDPWMDNPFHQSKGKCLDKWAATLERKVVEHAAAVSLNTEPLRKAFLTRYPHIPEDRFFVMPNGYDLADFNLAGAPSEASDSASYLDLYHAGFLYGVRDPAPLLDAIRDVNQEISENGLPAKLIRFVQIGEVQLSYDIAQRYQDLVGAGSLVLKPSRPYKECLAELTTADVVVNIQPFTVSQIPSKLYDYLALNKPMISITPDGGALSEVIKQKHLGLHADPSRPHEVVKALKMLTLKPAPKLADYTCRNEFDVRGISNELANKVGAVMSQEPTQ